MARLKVLMIAALAMCLGSVAYARQGTATFHSFPYVPSKCNGYKNDGVMIASATNAIWNNGAACNTFYRMKCTGSSALGAPKPCKSDTITVKIVDLCPIGCHGLTFNLSKEAFTKIANPNAGNILIDYTPA